MSIKLGDRVKDTISGFEGVAICHAKHLYGCDTIGIKPEKLHEGKPITEVYFDVLQVEKVEKRTSEAKPQGEGVG